MTSFANHQFTEPNSQFALRMHSEQSDRVGQPFRSYCAYLMLASDGSIIRWTPEAEVLFGYASDEARQNNIYHVLNANRAAGGDFERYLAAAYHDGKVDFNCCFNRKDGTQFSGHGEIKPVWHRGVFQGYILAIAQ
jgi:PAS domain-containing protein